MKYSFSTGRGSCTGDHLFTAKLKEQLVFSLSYTTSNEWIEIYDVHTQEAYRRRGIASQCLRAFLSHFRGRKFWAGVVDYAVVPFYTKLGFGAKRLWVVGFPFHSLA
jgi:GNAT superfamily N-acetyltransferase